jgi:hypothetical protein
MTYTARFADGTTKTRTSKLGYRFAWCATVLRPDGSTVSKTYGFSRDEDSAKAASVAGHGWKMKGDARSVVGEVVAAVAA